MRRIVDLSMPVHADRLTFPRVPPPALCVYESHAEFAERIGAAEYGVDSLTASYLVVQNDHVGSHCDARRPKVMRSMGAATSAMVGWLSRSNSSKLSREGLMETKGVGGASRMSVMALGGF